MQDRTPFQLSSCALLLAIHRVVVNSHAIWNWELTRSVGAYDSRTDGLAHDVSAEGLLACAKGLLGHAEHDPKANVFSIPDCDTIASFLAVLDITNRFYVENCVDIVLGTFFLRSIEWLSRVRWTRKYHEVSANFPKWPKWPKGPQRVQKCLLKVDFPTFGVEKSWKIDFSTFGHCLRLSRLLQESLRKK